MTKALQALFGNSEGEHEELEEIETQQNVLLSEEDIILERENQILGLLKPRLARIKIKFRTNKGVFMAEGAVVMNVGQKTIASIDGFDQFGQPFLGVIPAPSWAIDDSALDTISADVITPADEDVLSVAAGVANLTATVTNAQGTVLTDTEAITNVVPQVLTTVKINFTTPA